MQDLMQDLMLLGDKHVLFGYFVRNFLSTGGGFTEYFLFEMEFYIYYL